MNAQAIYNEFDPYAAQWLENLAAGGHVAPGRVDRRSIADLTPDDVAGPGQRHFFAGIGGWSRALRIAGIDDHESIWTGSCPCQPLSDAGKRLGVRDPRHLWPTWFELIRECRPPVVFGEQVASSLGLAWFDPVRADLEGCGYAVGASDLCAAGVGAPHIRQRLYFVAVTPGVARRLQLPRGQARRADAEALGRSEADVMGYAGSARGEGRESRRVANVAVDAGGALAVANATSFRRSERVHELRPREYEPDASRCGSIRIVGDADAQRRARTVDESSGGGA